MAKEDKVINIIKGRIEEADNGTLFFNNSFPEFDESFFQVVKTEGGLGDCHTQRHFFLLLKNDIQT